MKTFVLVSLGATLLATGAAAQQYNAASASILAEPPTTGGLNEGQLPPNYNGDRSRSPLRATALERIQALCAEDSDRAMQNCARVKQAMAARFAELGRR